jgi:hypothetical protein
MLIGSLVGREEKIFHISFQISHFSLKTTWWGRREGLPNDKEIFHISFFIEEALRLS